MPGQNDFPSPDNYQQTSFPQPLIAPNDEPDEGSLLYVAYNPLWTEVLMAAMDQLVQYGTWQGDSASKIEAVNRAVYLKWMLQNPVNVVPERQPYWDEETGSDATGDDEATGFPWYEELSDWAVTAFLAVSFTPDAAIQFVTTARKLRLWFRTRDYGAIVNVLVDGLSVGEVDTYSESPDMVEFAYDIPEPEGFTAQDVPTWTLRVEHTGTHNANATPTAAGYGAEVIRKHIEWGVTGTGGNRVWRISYTGELEYSDDGGQVWEPATDDPEYPTLEARTEPTADEKLCLASRNAAEVIRLTYETAVTEWNDSLDPVATASEVLALIGATIGIFFAGAWAVLFAFGAVLFNQMLTGLTGLLIGDWSDGDTESLTCVLLSYATLNPDNTVTFDYESVLSEAPGVLAIGGTQGFVRWILETMGSDGLNHAGATTSIESYDCQSCALDCWKWVNVGVQAVNALYTFKTFNSSVSPVLNIKKVIVDYTLRPNSGATCIDAIGQISISGGNLVLEQLCGDGNTGTLVWEGNLLMDEFYIQVKSQYSTGSNYPLIDVTFEYAAGWEGTWEGGSAC